MSTGEKVIVLVGATSGLGRQAAGSLAAAGHRLILVGRDPARAARLGRAVPAAHLVVADVATLDGVERVAREVYAVTDRVDVLVNNAGVMLPRRQETAEGMELNFAVHHLAPYSVTGRLLPLLAGGRVVNVNSEGHRAPLRGDGPARIDFADLQARRAYDPFLVYSRTKLANLLFSYELQRRNPELAVVAVHPGMVRTDLGRHFPRIQVALVGAFSSSAAHGAKPVVRLATAPDVQRGAYYDRFTPIASSSASYDLETAARLWAETEKLRGPFAASPRL
ncbi:SDR family NAD(P)-dependent oxidoreductase [Plantactinospora mayteni]|uniref:Short-chain dehydrogenase n=1 Tax=Plantactinospora mayteni TaxID=566021 RepID=A0ABQ4EFX7_9ACTN|nr:SDR family NAD(P)-dependent oxidoreductase [Plantactinospora mayteni]GIG93626.1 short-chain dehydrogenase [Plantactinospora mayteni]